MDLLILILGILVAAWSLPGVAGALMIADENNVKGYESISYLFAGIVLGWWMFWQATRGNSRRHNSTNY